jgi:hypothetical protein
MGDGRLVVAGGHAFWLRHQSICTHSLLRGGPGDLRYSNPVRHPARRAKETPACAGVSFRLSLPSRYTLRLRVITTPDAIMPIASKLNIPGSGTCGTCRSWPPLELTVFPVTVQSPAGPVGHTPICAPTEYPLALPVSTTISLAQVPLVLVKCTIIMLDRLFGPAFGLLIV